MVRWLALLLVAIFACKASSEPPDAGRKVIRGAIWNPSVPGQAYVSNPAWTQAAWFFDPANSTGCASDSNTCTQSTCGGGTLGPCLTYREVFIGRMGCTGCPCPQTTQDTTFTWLSSQADGTDPVTACPLIGMVPLGDGGFRAPSILYTGTLIADSSGETLNVVTAKVYSPAQDLRTTFTIGGASTYPIGDIVQNLTHASMSIIRNRGANYFMSQPVTALTIPRGNGQGWQGSATEVDTWTTGDSVLVSHFTTVTVVKSEPTVVGFNSNGLVQFAHMYWPDWGAAATAKGSDPTVCYIGTDLGEMWTDRALIWNLSGITAGSTAPPNTGSNASTTNVYMSGGVLGGNTVAKECFDSGDLTMFAGAITTNNNQQSIQLAGTFLDGDISLNPAAQNQLYFNSVNLIGSVELTHQGNVPPGGVVDLQIRNSATGTNRLWGTGGILNAGYGRVTWSPTSTATIAFGGLSGGLKLENIALGSSACGGVINSPIALTVANLDTACDAGFGGDAARASLWGGGSFTSSVIGP